MNEEALEIFKLEPMDRKLLFWMIANDRGAIPSWVEQTVEEYRIHKEIKINILKLSDEIDEAIAGG